MKKLILLILLLCTFALLVGCGTTGKKYDVTFKISGNQNTTINIDPSITSDSGDSGTDSSNVTDVGLDGAADALEKGVAGGAVDAIKGVL